jgi:hypothetical protein
MARSISAGRSASGSNTFAVKTASKDASVQGMADASPSLRVSRSVASASGVARHRQRQHVEAVIQPGDAGRPRGQHPF